MNTTSNITSMYFQETKVLWQNLCIEKQARETESRRVDNCTNQEELIQIIKDNILWYGRNATSELFKKSFEDDFLFKNGFYFNKNIVDLKDTIFLLENSTVETMWGNSTVEAMRGNSTVKTMLENSTVETMWGNSTVKTMLENSTVKTMRGDSTVEAMLENSNVEMMWGDSTVKTMRGDSTVKTMRGDSTVEAMWGNSTVEAMWGNSTVEAMLGNSTVETMMENSIRKCFKTNPKIYLVKGSFQIIELQTTHS